MFVIMIIIMVVMKILQKKILFVITKTLQEKYNLQ